MESLRELDVRFARDLEYDDDDTQIENLPAELILALRSNSSMTEKASVAYCSPGENLFNEEEERELERCAARNRGVSEWTDSPLSIQQKLWPNAFHRAGESGPNKAFLALREAAGTGVDLLRKGRKRKLYFRPS